MYNMLYVVDSSSKHWCAVDPQKHSFTPRLAQNTASLIAFFPDFYFLEDFRIFLIFLNGRFASADGYIIWNISVNTVHTAEAVVHRGHHSW